jgi:DNA repair exonuclease SbcCD ATPase subunit
MNSLIRCPVCSKTHSDTCQLTDARCYRCRWEVAQAEYWRDALQAMRAESIELRKDLAKLQSALREEKEMRGVFERTCIRRMEIINNLRNETKVNGEYIALQATRLKAARADLRRIYTASGLHVPNDDEALDP